MKTEQAIVAWLFWPMTIWTYKCKEDKWDLHNYIMDITDALGPPSFSILFLSVILWRRAVTSISMCWPSRSTFSLLTLLQRLYCLLHVEMLVIQNDRIEMASGSHVPLFFTIQNLFDELASTFKHCLLYFFPGVLVFERILSTQQAALIK